MSEVIDQVKKVNPLLERLNKLPGDTIRLPSRGLFYLNDELDPEVKNGEIHVKPMTGTDELIMKSVDMLYQGTAVETVLKRCAPQILKPMDLLTSDIDFILTHLRRISYGPTLTIIYECECQQQLDVDGKKKKKSVQESYNNEYQIPIDSLIRTTKELNPKDYADIYTLTLSNGQVVKLKPATFKSFIQTQQVDADSLQEVPALEDFIARVHADITYSIDGETDRDNIIEWYKAAYTFLLEEIRERLPEINKWGTEFKYKIKCHSCKKEHELSTQLNPMYFFMLPSSRNNQKQ